MHRKSNTKKVEPAVGLSDGVAFPNARGKRRGGGGGCDPSSLPKSNSANSLSSRCEPPNRRNSPQKSKGLDKKPRGRGSGFGGPVRFICNFYHNYHSICIICVVKN